MDWQEFVRHTCRPAGLFVWALLAVLLAYLFWPWSSLFVGSIAAYSLARKWAEYRAASRRLISEMPPLCHEDWRSARSKLKKR